MPNPFNLDAWEEEKEARQVEAWVKREPVTWEDPDDFCDTEDD